MSNILPYHQKKAIHQIRTLRLAVVTIWSCILLIFIAGVLLIPKLVMVDEHYSVSMQQVSQLEQSGAVANPIDIADLDRRVANLSKKLASSVAPSPTMYIATVRAVPASGITLTGFSIEGNSNAPTLAVAGTSTSREALQRFVAALEGTNGVSSVDSPVSNYVKSGSNSFQITVVFK